jgi:hypothetical protein
MNQNKKGGKKLRARIKVINDQPRNSCAIKKTGCLPNKTINGWAIDKDHAKSKYKKLKK